MTPALCRATPHLSRRQTVTDGSAGGGVSGVCDVAGPETINFDKSKGPTTFVLTKTGDCVIDFIDIYQIVSYSPKDDYQLFSYRVLEDGVSVEVTILLAWPKPSASASDRNQYLVYKGYASRAEKDEGKQPMIQRFVKISIVERQPEGNVENYRDPLSSYLMKPPTPIYFLDEESAMANASCVTTDFRFAVRAAAKLDGVNPKLSMEVSVIQQNAEGKWEMERSWSDGGESGDDWALIASDVGTTVATTRSAGRAEMTVDVVNPLQDAYFVFNVLVEDELNWYRTGSAHYIAKWDQPECDGSKSDIDSIWVDIDANTPATTTTPATTIRPEIIIDINDNNNNISDGDENEDNNNNNNNNNDGDNTSENNNNNNNNNNDGD